MSKEHRWTNSTDPGILRKKPDVKRPNNTDLFVFGYSCNLFRDDKKALEMDQGKHLIPWNGDESLKIDRYDARGHLSELSQFESSSYDFALTLEEREIERLCDKERYRSLEQNEEEQLMYQEEEFKRLQSLANGYGQVSYQYTDDSHPPSTKTDSEENNTPHEDLEPFIPSPLLDLPQNILLPATKRENERIEKTAFYIATHGPQVELLVRTRQANNEKLDFLHSGKPLNPYYNFILDRIKHGRYRPGIYSHHREEEDQQGDYLHPILSQSSVESAPSIPTIAYKPSGDSSYDLLVKNIKTVQQTHEVAAEIHQPGKQRSTFSGGLPPYTQVPSNLTSSESMQAAIPPPNILAVINRLLTLAKNMGVHPSNLAQNLLTKKSINMEFLQPEHPYHKYYMEKVNTLFKEKEESNQGSEPLVAEEFIYSAETSFDYPLDDLLLFVNDSQRNYDTSQSQTWTVNTKNYRCKKLKDWNKPKKSEILPPGPSCDNDAPNVQSVKPAPVSFSIKKPKEEKLEITSALPLEESSSEVEDVEGSEKVVKQKPVKKRQNAPLENISTKMKEHISVTAELPKVDSHIQQKSSPQKEQPPHVKSIPPTVHGAEEDESVKYKDIQAKLSPKKKVKSEKTNKKSFDKAEESTGKKITRENYTMAEKWNEKRTERHKGKKSKRLDDKKLERKISPGDVVPVHVDPPPVPLDISSPRLLSPSPPPAIVDKEKKEERKKRAKFLINKIKSGHKKDLQQLEEESSQDVEVPPLFGSSVVSEGVLSNDDGSITPKPPSHFTSFLPHGPNKILVADTPKKDITQVDPQKAEEHLRLQVKKSLEKLAQNMVTPFNVDFEDVTFPTNTSKKKISPKAKSHGNPKESIIKDIPSSWEGTLSAESLSSDSQKIKPSELRLRDLLKSFEKERKRKLKHAGDSSVDCISSSSSDSSSDSENESTTSDSSVESHTKHKKRSHKRKKKKKHRHHSKKTKSSKHSKKSHRKKKRRRLRSSSSN